MRYFPSETMNMPRKYHGNKHYKVLFKTSLNVTNPFVQYDLYPSCLLAKSSMYPPTPSEI